MAKQTKTPPKQKIKPKAKPNKPHEFKQKDNGKNATGRPEVVLDLERVKLCCQFNPTDEELAALLKISHTTFSKLKNADPAVLEAMEEGKALGRASLRGKQFDIAMKGNVAMLIWIGKQQLGQKDKILHGNDTESPLIENIGSLNREQLISEIAERTRRLGIAVAVTPATPARGDGKGMATPSGSADARA